MLPSERICTADNLITFTSAPPAAGSLERKARVLDESCSSWNRYNFQDRCSNYPSLRLSATHRRNDRDRVLRGMTLSINLNLDSKLQIGLRAVSLGLVV